MEQKINGTIGFAGSYDWSGELSVSNPLHKYFARASVLSEKYEVPLDEIKEAANNLNGVMPGDELWVSKEKFSQWLDHRTKHTIRRAALADSSR